MKVWQVGLPRRSFSRRLVSISVLPLHSQITLTDTPSRYLHAKSGKMLLQ